MVAASRPPTISLSSHATNLDSLGSRTIKGKLEIAIEECRAMRSTEVRHCAPAYHDDGLIAVMTENASQGALESTRLCIVGLWSVPLPAVVPMTLRAQPFPVHSPSFTEDTRLEFALAGCHSHCSLRERKELSAVARRRVPTYVATFVVQQHTHCKC